MSKLISCFPASSQAGVRARERVRLRPRPGKKDLFIANRGLQSQGLEDFAQRFAQRFASVRAGASRCGIDRARLAGDRTEGKRLVGLLRQVRDNSD